MIAVLRRWWRYRCALSRLTDERLGWGKNAAFTPAAMEKLREEARQISRGPAA